MATDPVTLELVKNAIESVVDEMALTMMRTAYSSNLKSSNDLSAAIVSLDGELLAQGFTLPMQLGSIPDAMATVIEKFRGTWQSGDVVILNDPYEGGTHLPDIFLIKPLFLDGEHVAYCATIAHHTDIGGRVAGGNASDSTEIYQEGLRLPPIKLYDAGNANGAIFEIIAKNVRVPDNLLGDLRAQLAAIHIGERGLDELVQRWGKSELLTALDDLMAYTERLARAEIAQWPDGVYSFTDYIDDDGMDPEPIPIAVTATVTGDSLEIDFAGTAPQVRGAINATASFAKSAVYACVRALMSAGIPNNGGYFRPITCKIPSRSVINPELPAPVAARGLTGFRMTNAVLGALAQVVPDEMPACESGGDTGITIAGYYDDDHAYVFLEFLHASWGGRPDKDGIDACSSISANFSNNPIEFLEGDHPLRIEEYAFVPDTGGAGQYRGGLALKRTYRFLEREGALQLRTDRQKFRPWGLHGGKPGAPSSNELVRGGETEVPPSKAYRILHHGDVLKHTMAGAGGYGDPLERDPTAVVEDVSDEKVSVLAAAAEYGVVLDPQTLIVDEDETGALRSHAGTGGRRLVTAPRQATDVLPWEAPSILTPRLELVSMSAAFLRASLERRLADAAADLRASLPESWPDPWRRFVEIRLADLKANPGARPWLLRAIILREPIRQLVGSVGFHDPPGPDRAVEIGYAVEPEFRRRGYAEEAATALCAWAADDPGVDRILASISPENAPSLALIGKLGFTQTGRRWDDEDGWELTFERVITCGPLSG